MVTWPLSRRVMVEGCHTTQQESAHEEVAGDEIHLSKSQPQ